MKIIKKIGSFFSALSPVFTYIIVIIALSLLSIIISAVSKFSTDSFTNIFTLDSLFILVSNIITNAACAAAALVEMKIQRYTFRDLSPVKQNWKMYLLTVAFAPGIYFVMRFINFLFLQITGIPTTYGTEQMTAMDLADSFTFTLTYPFAEELIFRGLTYKNFEGKFPAFFSAAVITISFMLFRSNVNMLYGLLLGAVLYFFRYKFGDLKLCILLHFTMNLTYCLTLLVNISVFYTMIKAGCAVGIVIAAATMFFMLKFASKPKNESSVS
ncbi:MAG: lysostaphin resistance A-like protein [Huintestinicola sp.]